MDDNETPTPTPATIIEAPGTTIEPTAPLEPKTDFPPDAVRTDPEMSWSWHVEHWVSRAAALVYHDMVASEQLIVKWRHNNSQLAGLFDMAMTYLTNKAATHGVPVGALQPAMMEVEIALKQLALQDPTFNTGPAKVL